MSTLELGNSTNNWFCNLCLFPATVNSSLDTENIASNIDSDSNIPPENTSININSTGLKMAHLNVRSLLGKFDQLKLLMQSKPLDILTLSETWLYSDIADSELELHGYSCCRLDRANGKRGGGVIIYCKEGLVFSRRDDLINDNETLWIQITRGKAKPLLIGCVYRPPNQNLDEFLANFESSLRNSKPSNKNEAEIVVLGDFNVDLSSKRKENRPLKRKLLNSTTPFDLHQIVNTPTRITQHSKTTIDLIFTNTQHKVVESGVCHLALSDHSMVYCVYKSGLPKVTPRTIEYRSFKTYDKDAFIADLKGVPWHLVFDETENIDVDEAVNLWYKMYLSVADAHAPIKTKRTRGPSNPWMSPHIIEAMRDRDYHHHKAHSSKSEYHWNMYRKFRNYVRRQIDKAKSEYYIKLITDCKGHTSQLWKSLKQVIPGNSISTSISTIISDGITYSTSQGIASALNTYFVNIGMKLAASFTSLFPNYNDDLRHCVAEDHNFTFNTIPEDFVRDSLKCLKGNKATGLDKVGAL